MGEKAEPGDDSDSDLEPESNNTEEKPAYDEATQDLIKKADTARYNLINLSNQYYGILGKNLTRFRSEFHPLSLKYSTHFYSHSNLV